MKFTVFAVFAYFCICFASSETVDVYGHIHGPRLGCETVVVKSSFRRVKEYTFTFPKASDLFVLFPQKVCGHFCNFSKNFSMFHFSIGTIETYNLRNETCEPKKTSSFSPICKKPTRSLKRYNQCSIATQPWNQLDFLFLYSLRRRPIYNFFFLSNMIIN